MRAISPTLPFVAVLLGGAACGSAGSHGTGAAGSHTAGGQAGTSSAGRGGVANRGGGSSARSGAGGKGGKGGKGLGGAGGSVGGRVTGGSSGHGAAGDGAQGGTTGGSAGIGEAGGPTSGASGDAGSGGDTTAHSVTFTIDTAANVHPISPLIYGVNPGAVSCSDAGARFGLCRLGGVRWSTYNWETNASNAGDTLCSQNDGALAASDEPGVAVTSLVSEANAADAATLVTVPVLDYVAADKLGGTPPDDCSGDVRKSGTGLEYLDTRFNANVATKPSPFVTPPDATDDSVYQDEFVAFVKAAAGDARVMFALDNQPGLWSITQQAVHLDPPTYAEVVSRNVEYAKVVREQWLEAPISGYVGYGWADFTSLQGSSDAATEGLFLDYYLDGLAQASEEYGAPLIDYLDVHWYSEVYVGSDRIIYNSAVPEVAATRVQAPRSLWDASYIENSWISRDDLGNAPIRLIPWLKQHIQDHFPGTKLAISEWNYGGGTDVSGAIATADALGIFGREEVGLAAWASVSDDDPYTLGAFRMFRNYDGAGAAFGDTSVSAASSAVEVASVYASTDSNDSERVVIVAINRSDETLDASVTIAGSSLAFTTAATYLLTSAAAVPSRGPDLVATASNAFAYAMPAYSVSVIVPSL